MQTRDQFKGQQADQINGLLNVLYGLLGLAIVISILGIINTLALSVVERRREIGMLRAIGAQRKQVRRTIQLESLLIAIFGAILGLVLGITFGALFTHTLRSQGLTVISMPWTQDVDLPGGRRHRRACSPPCGRRSAPPGPGRWRRSRTPERIASRRGGDGRDWHSSPVGPYRGGVTVLSADPAHRDASRD